jgi:hypothetical protein
VTSATTDRDACTELRGTPGGLPLPSGERRREGACFSSVRVGGCRTHARLWVSAFTRALPVDRSRCRFCLIAIARLLSCGPRAALLLIVRCDSGCDRRRASAPAPNTAVGWELLGLVAALPIADEAQRDGGAAIPEALREPRGVGASSEREAISSGDHVSPLAGCHAG